MNTLLKFEDFLNEKFLSTTITNKELYDKIKKLEDSILIAFDTETSGLPTKNHPHQFTQISAIAAKISIDDDGNVKIKTLDTFNKKVSLTKGTKELMKKDKEENYEPKRRAEVAFKLTRYGEHHGQYEAEENVLRDFKKFIDKHDNPVLVAQNAKFDMGMLSNRSWLYPEDKNMFKNYPVFDTLIVFKKFWGPVLLSRAKLGDENSKRILDETGKGFGGVPAMRLGKIAGILGIEATRWHDSLADCELLIATLKYALNDIFSFIDQEKDVLPIKGQIRSKMRKFEK